MGLEVMPEAVGVGAVAFGGSESGAASGEPVVEAVHEEFAGVFGGHGGEGDGHVGLLGFDHEDDGHGAVGLRDFVSGTLGGFLEDGEGGVGEVLGEEFTVGGAAALSVDDDMGSVVGVLVPDVLEVGGDVGEADGGFGMGECDTLVEGVFKDDGGGEGVDLDTDALAGGSEHVSGDGELALGVGGREVLPGRFVGAGVPGEVVGRVLGMVIGVPAVDGLEPVAEVLGFVSGE